MLHMNQTYEVASSESEPVRLSEVPLLYQCHMQDPIWGAVKWSIRRRKEFPIHSLVQKMKKAGVWDLDETELAENQSEAIQRQRAAKRQENT